MNSRYNATFVLSDAEIAIMSTINILFSICGTFGNFFVCLAFLLHRNFRNSMNVLIFSLACSDLLVCVVAQPMYVVSLIQDYPKDHDTFTSEGLRKRLTWISLLASAGNLLGVTVDRYLMISNPLRYSARSTNNRACIFAVFVWFIALPLGAATESHGNVKIAGQLYVVLLLVGIIIPLYCRILCIARRHARSIHMSLSQMQIHFRADNSRILAQHSRSSTLQQADRNSLKTVGIISSIFIIGWFPILILPFFYRAGIWDRQVLLEVLQWANTLALCSSACNPVVYSWRDRRFRKALNVTYSKWKARRSVSVQDINHIEKPKICFENHFETFSAS